MMRKHIVSHTMRRVDMTLDQLKALVETFEQERLEDDEAVVAFKQEHSAGFVVTTIEMISTQWEKK